MKTMIRCDAIDMAGLAKAQAHGLREDYTSRKRRVRDLPPLVAGGLDLRALYDAHVAGAEKNSAAKKTVLHFVVRFPPEVLEQDTKLFSGDRKNRQKMMMRQAIDFINRTHGGDAVFAARVDRDEAGETIVDVFATPRYEKRTKRTKPDETGITWISATKFGKELTEKHQAEIQRRHPKAKGKLSAPRHVGIAVNIEWREYFQRRNDLILGAKIEKESSAPDRLGIEEYKAIQDEKTALKIKAKAIEAASDELDDREQLLDNVLSRARSLFSAMAKVFGVSLPGNVEKSMDMLEEAVDSYNSDISKDDDQSPSPEM